MISHRKIDLQKLIRYLDNYIYRLDKLPKPVNAKFILRRLKQFLIGNQTDEKWTEGIKDEI